MSLFRSLLIVIAGSTQRELARQVRYLKVENEILRKLPGRITIMLKERQRLVKFGSKGAAGSLRLGVLERQDSARRSLTGDDLSRCRWGGTATGAGTDSEAGR